jgi:hypothetical protein
MRRIALAIVTVIGLTACQQMITEPATNPNVAIRFLGNPPPPPIDSGSVGVSSEYNFFLNLTFFYNTPGTNGWLTLSSDQTGGATGDPNARISFHQGDITGKGNWYIPVDGGLLTLDLGSAGKRSTIDRKDSYNIYLDGMFHGVNGDSAAVTGIQIKPQETEVIITHG